MDPWDIVKHTNISHIGVSKEEEKKKRAGKYFKEVMTENFPKLIQNVN